MTKGNTNKTPLLSLWKSIVTALFLSACGTSPTGRHQLLLFPEAQVARMGETAYTQMRQKEPIVENSPLSRYVTCVANAVTAVVPAPEGGGNWEVTVFQGNDINAFALPGGKIGVYAGLLQAAQTPAQLAAVIGHEIAHVQAHHANARLSAQYATETGLALIQALGEGTAAEGRQAMALLGLGVQVGVLLPFSRSQETEADILGLRYMAQAGFDPNAAVTLWQNMARLSGPRPPALLSTHPAGEQRIRTLSENTPQVLPLYRQAQAAGRSPACRPPASN